MKEMQLQTQYITSYLRQIKRYLRMNDFNTSH